MALRMLPSVMLVAGVAVRAWSGQWAVIGPDGGSVLAVAHDPATPSTVYAATAHGVVKSTDGGASWSRTSMVGYATALAIDPVTPTTVYATASGVVSYDVATELQGGAVFKSTDAGTTWTKVLDTGSVYGAFVALAIDPTAPATVYAGTEGQGLFKTSNGGTSWTPSATGLSEPNVRSIAIDPLTPSTVFAATCCSGIGMFKSTNGGATWTPSNTGLAHVGGNSVAVDPVTPSTVYFGSPSTVEVWKSIDGGGSWSASSAGLPSSQYLASLAVDPSDPARVYAAINGASEGGLFVSVDAGASWSATGCTGFGLVGVDITDAPSRLLVAASNRFDFPRRGGIYRSDDAGASCALSSHGITTFDALSIAADPAHPGTLYMGDEQTAAYRTIDGGATWTEANAGLTGIERLLHTMTVDPAGTAYLASGNDIQDHLWKSIDGGTSWTSTLGPFPLFQSMANHPSTAGSVLVGLDGIMEFPFFFPASVGRTVDGGATWTQTTLSGVSQVTSLAIDPSSPLVVYAGTDAGVLKSIDGGVTFPTSSIGLPTGQPVQAIAVDPTDGAILYAAAFDLHGLASGLFKSVDAGATWSPATTGLTPYIFAIAIDPAQPSTLWVATYSQGVFQSDDGGATWSAVNEGLTDLHTTSLTLDPVLPGRLYVGTRKSSVFVRDFGPCGSTCGNGVVDGCEQCDDGAGLNGTAGSCCSAICRVKPTGTACADDGSLCTGDACDGAGACAHTATPDPLCVTASTNGAVVRIDDRAAPHSDRVTFEWGKGPAIAKTEFGTPGAGTSYELCVYDTTPTGPTVAYRGRALTPCGSTPCWREQVAGWRFASTGGADGVTSVVLTSGSDRKSKLQVGAKAAILAPGALPLAKDPRVTAQLRTSDGRCWGATFSTATRNDARRFKAKSD